MKKIFRKIHLWLSVPFGIFITLICLSGAMLVFEKEITEWCRPDVYFVEEANGRPLPADSLMRLVSATLPDSVEATGVTIPSDPERTWQVSLSKPRRASLYVNPYTGEITGRSERLAFYDTMFHLHRWMMGSSTGFGKLLVGVSTLMLVFILITGILMWLSNRKKPLRKSLVISFTKGWPKFWHDLHVAGGIYTTIFLLAIALTGLTWSFSWYRTGFYGMFGVEASAGSHGGGHGGAERGGHGSGRGNRGEGRHAGHGRDSHGDNDAIHRHDGTHNGDQSDTGRDMAGTENRERRGGRRHHNGETGQEQRTENNTDIQQPASSQHAREAQPETDNEERGTHNNYATDNNVSERSDNGDENTERRGRYGRGGRGRHQHNGDSTAGYGRHHRPDSLRTYHHAEPKTAIAGNRSETATPKDDAVRTTASDRRNRSAGERKRNAAKPAVAEVRTAIDTATIRKDSAAIAIPAQAAPFAQWQDVYDLLAKSHPGYRQITIFDGSASVVPAGRNSLRSGDRFDFNPEDGMITGCTPYASQDKATHVRSTVYTVHVGSWGGLFTRWITFIAALIGATLPLTGYYLWIRRLRNKSKHKAKA